MTTQPLTSVWQNDKIAIQQERGIMNELEAVSLLKAQRWTPTIRIRGGKRYLYAQQRQGTEIVERYIAPVNRLDRFTEEQIITMLGGDNRPKSTAALEWQQSVVGMKHPRA